MIISITGTPGVGKTKIADKLSELTKMKSFHLNEFIKKNKLYDRYDKKYNSYEVDPIKIKKIKIADNTIVEGHLAHYIKSDICIILRCSPDELKRRLSKRRWKKLKIYENLSAEILDVIELDAESQCKKVIQVDTTKLNPEMSAKKILKYIKAGKSDKIDWLSKFENYLMEFENLKKVVMK